MVNCPRCGSSRIYRNEDSPKFDWRCYMCKCEFNSSASGAINFDDLNNILKDTGKPKTESRSKRTTTTNNIKTSTISQYISKAKEFFNKKDYENAYENAKEAIKLDNKNISVWIMVTEIFIALNKYDDAISSIMTLLSIDHENAEAWYLKSRVHIGQLRYEAALNASEKALNLEKNNDKYLEMNNNIKEFINYNFNDFNKEKFYFYPSNEVNLSTILDSKNLDLYKKKKISSKVYHGLINNFIDETLRNFNNSDDLTLYDKIKNFASLFANIEYKSEGEELGLYACNIIKVDSRQNNIFQIITFIHELAHHLLAEIFELCLMYIFDSFKTDDIETFVWYSLTFEKTYHLMNEYCAHTVENYFMPKRYENFGSFIKVLDEFDLKSPEDLKNIEYATKLGNTFAQDIIGMLNKFFNDKLDKEIKKQFVLDMGIIPNHAKCKFKTDDAFDEDTKLEKINLLYLESLVHVKTHNSLPKLMHMLEAFKKSNLDA